MAFKDLKVNSNTSISTLIEELNKQSKGSYVDERMWKPSFDKKKGVGTALIRFLPECGSQKIGWVKYGSYFFKGPGGYYVEKSLSSIGQTDPVYEVNHELWESGIEANKEIVRGRKLQKKFVSNVYVISDPENPDNEGKVFLFEYGNQIFKKIQEKIKPEFEHEESFDPFNFWTGANFRIKIKVGANGMPNYESSAFESPSPLLGGDDAKLEAIYNQQYDLGEFIDPKNYKSYDELKTKLMKVLGKGSSIVSRPKTAESLGNENDEQTFEELAASMKSSDSKMPWKTDEEETEEDGDDELEYFKQFQS
jgi:hypothetical protein